jgi:hypothetical protein
MAINEKQLVGLQRAEFAKASRLRLHVLGAQLVIASVSVFAVFVVSAVYCRSHNSIGIPVLVI